MSKPNEVPPTGNIVPPTGSIVRPARIVWLPALSWFAGQVAAGLGVLLLLAAGEVGYHRMAHGLQGNIAGILFIAGLNVTLGWLFICPWLLLIFLVTRFFSAVFSRRLLQGLIFLLILVQLLLMNYFSKALVPLGADLYGYSWKDIQQTVGSAGGVQWQFILVFLVIFTLLWLMLRMAGKKTKVPVFLAPVMPAAGLIIWCLGWSEITYGPSEYTRNLVMDKTGYFLRDSWRYFFHHSEGTDIYSDDYLQDNALPGNAPARQYLAESVYPFLYRDSTPDVLTSFLQKEQQPPNIVLILVEGLGRAFTNEGAYLGNFTPFLDSLSRESLYWNNFLSSGGRTFAALPSILGSLPFARNGFLELGSAMPPAFSLINLLKANGYHTSFYYGGDAHFDNMEMFLRAGGIDELKDGSSFPPGYTKIPANNGFTWGYNDQELFRWWLNSRPIDAGTPQLSILLTVSTHSPFLLNEPDVYHRRFETRMTELGLDEAGKQERRPYKDQYASILYTDNALRTFFAACAKRQDFSHTIFLITGDHRMPEIPMRDKIDRFHVPLMIYSPLLRRKAQFLSVSSHFDIAPSLLAYLEHSYHLRMPPAVTWMGDGLDTAGIFRNIHSCPLMQTKTDLVDYVQGEDHLNGTTLFRLKSDLSEDQSPGDEIQQRLMSAMERFRQQNESWLRTGALMPDTLFQHYTTPEPKDH